MEIVYLPVGNHLLAARVFYFQMGAQSQAEPEVAEVVAQELQQARADQVVALTAPVAEVVAVQEDMGAQAEPAERQATVALRVLVEARAQAVAVVAVGTFLELLPEEVVMATAVMAVAAAA